MRTPYGEISEDDVRALEYKLWWYLRYGNLPGEVGRSSERAREDYGMLYERYVGYLFEEKGFKVQYNGLEKGLEDGGIDLIARAPRKIRLIQCKRWRKCVDSDVISRLHGGVERFIWNECHGKSEMKRISICGVLATSGTITAEAKNLARHLGIYVMPELEYHSFPAIKAQRCALGGAGRFLLPFNRGYDRMHLDFSRGDAILSSIREAFLRGFFYPEYHKDILKKIRNNK